MTNYFIGAVLLILIGYGSVEAWPLIVGPTLSISSPENYASIPGGILSVSGKAARGAVLTLNGEPVLHEEDGSFSSTRTFPRGGSLLTFVATDRFGKSITVTRTLYVP